MSSHIFSWILSDGRKFVVQIDWSSTVTSPSAVYRLKSRLSKKSIIRFFCWFRWWKKNDEKIFLLFFVAKEKKNSLEIAEGSRGNWPSTGICSTLTRETDAADGLVTRFEGSRTRSGRVARGLFFTIFLMKNTAIPKTQRSTTTKKKTFFFFVPIWIPIKTNPQRPLVNLNDQKKKKTTQRSTTTKLNWPHRPVTVKTNSHLGSCQSHFSSNVNKNEKMNKWMKKTTSLT